MQNPTKKILTFPLRIVLILVIYSVLFKIMHWPYANQLLLIGSVLLMLLYSIRFLYKTEKTRIDIVKLGLVLVWTVNLVLKTYHIAFIAYALELILLILFVWWFIEDGLNYFTSRQLINNGFVKFFYYGFCIVAITLIIFGALFKIQHWPYGSLILTFGFLLLSIMLIVDYFVIKRP